MQVSVCGFVRVSAMPAEGRRGCQITGDGVICGRQPQVVGAGN